MEAEDACSAVMRICADWETISNEIERRWQDDLNFQAMTHLDFAASTQALSYVSRMVAECEHFAFYRARLITRAHVDAVNSPMLTKLFESNKSNLDSTWDKVLGLTKDWHGIDIKALPEWPKFYVLVQLRNASAHGRGGLTDKQLSTPNAAKSLISQLESVGCVVDGRRVRVQPGVVRDAARACRDFILSVDEATRSLPR